MSPGFQYSKDLWSLFAKLAAAPAEDSGWARPTTGNAGKSRGSACFNDVAAPGRRSQSEVERRAKARLTSSGEFVVFIQGIVAWLGLRLVVFAFGYIESSGRGW